MVSRRPFLYVLIVLWATSLAYTVAAQAALLAPRLPTGFVETPMVVREVDAFSEARDGVRIVRHGTAGTAVVPEGLPLPGPGRFIALNRFDLVEAGAREVEIRPTAASEPALILRPGAALIVTGDRSVELVHGAVRWGPGESVAVSLSETVIVGSGAARIELTHRTDGTAGAAVIVTDGRFDVEAGGALRAALRRGQRYDVALSAPTVDAALPALEAALDGALVTLRSGQSVTGASLAVLWETTAQVAGALFRAADRRAEVFWPDIVEREIAEALRIIAAHEFVPPPALGR